MEVIDQSLAGLEIFLDALSAIMLLLMAGIGTMVIRYSLRYLDGDPGQGHFLKWLSLTMGLVLLLIIWRHAEPDHDGDHGGGELDQSPVLRLNGR